MSAIHGIYCLDGRPVDRTVLERMVASATHRGPDGAGVWSHGPVGLGKRILWTTPESLHEQLPLANQTGDLVLTSDARLDNRDELIAVLNITHRPPEEIDDSALILCAYEKWGERCPERLLGDFAFAIWDERRQVLFCARDYFGLKPFYYYRSGQAFAFASEIKTLLCLPEVARRLNEVKVAGYLLSMVDDKTITFYQEILRLPPAHSMTVGQQATRVQSYWSLDPSRALQLASDEEYAEAFRERFTEAVRCRLRSAFPIGFKLSGGLDSSSIVCVARELLAQPGEPQVQTFSALFEGIPECDERHFINAVLSMGGLASHLVRGENLSPLADLDRILWHHDEPFYMPPQCIIHWALNRAAQEQGVRVLFGGFDGDNVVSHGFGHLTELARTGRWIRLSKELKGLATYFNRSPWIDLKDFCLKPLAPEPIHQAWRWLRGGNRLLNPDFARRVSLGKRWQTLQGTHFKPGRNAREEQCRLLTMGLSTLVVEESTRSAAAFSMELRYPFFDRRLVEFCLSLPPAQKLRDGWSRVVLRHALATSLPNEVRWRRSKGRFNPVLVRGLLAFERERLEAVILHDPRVIQEYLDVAALREAYQRYVSQGTASDAILLWKALILAAWLQRTGLTP